MLDWSLDDLERYSSVSRRSIVQFEKSKAVLKDSTMVLLKTAFEHAGVEFETTSAGVGVFLRKSS